MCVFHTRLTVGGEDDTMGAAQAEVPINVAQGCDAKRLAKEAEKSDIDALNSRFSGISSTSWYPAPRNR